MSFNCRRCRLLSNVPVEMYWYTKGANIGNTKPKWTMEVANIFPAISIKFEHNMLVLYIGCFLKPFPTIKPNMTLSHKGNTAKISPLENFCLKSFWLCTDSQSRGTRADHHIYTTHYLWFEHGFLNVLRIYFCRDSSLFSLSFLYFAVSFLYFSVSFLYFAVSFLYFAVGFLLFFSEFSFFFRLFSLFWRGFLYCTVSFLYFAIAFFILSSLSLFCREFSLFCSDFIYFAVTLIILPWFCFSCRDSYGSPYKNSKYVK